MCELGFFPILLEKDLLIVDKIFGPKTKFIYDKQIWKQMFAEILRFK